MRTARNSSSRSTTVVASVSITSASKSSSTVGSTSIAAIKAGTDDAQRAVVTDAPRWGISWLAQKYRATCSGCSTATPARPVRRCPLGARRRGPDGLERHVRHGHELPGSFGRLGEHPLVYPLGQQSDVTPPIEADATAFTVGAGSRYCAMGCPYPRGLDFCGAPVERRVTQARQFQPQRPPPAAGAQGFRRSAGERRPRCCSVPFLRSGSVQRREGRRPEG